MRVAAVDIGTNTVRLLVADVGESVVAVERGQRITRLGQGVDQDRALGAEPIERTLAAVEEFVARARSVRAERVRVAGTSALRDAANRTEFVEKVEAATGETLEVLDGAAEGRLAYAGATSWMDDGSYVVCDIGGGSTELITANDVISADVGSVRVRERYLKGDPPTAASVEAARDGVRAALVGLAAPKRIGNLGRLIGVAGTITTIGALDAGLKVYDSNVVHSYRLTADRVRHWSRQLNVVSTEQIRALGPVAPGREDVIGAGALVLEEVMYVLARDWLTVSERDILDGLVLEAVR